MPCNNIFFIFYISRLQKELFKFATHKNNVFKNESLVIPKKYIFVVSIVLVNNSFEKTIYERMGVFKVQKWSK